MLIAYDCMRMPVNSSSHGSSDQDVSYRWGFHSRHQVLDAEGDAGGGKVRFLLKRPDEKYVTEQAYKNPMFVEDVVRKVAVTVLKHPDITWFSAGVESFESIHKHSAYAYVDSNEIAGDHGRDERRKK